MRDELSVLSAFLAVADERSFTKAAKRLNISTSGLSHAIRRLEEQIGVRLLTRTTRSVSPTDAGEQLLAQLRPALSDIRGVLTSLSGLQSTPIGRIRLLCPRLAAKTVVGPKLGQFVRDYPAVELEITTDDSRLDLVSAGYDAGIQFGEYIAQDMVAVRVSPDLRPAIVARTRLLRVTPQADIAARRAEPSVHPLPAPRRERVQVGTRQRRRVPRDLGQRVRCSWMNSTWSFRRLSTGRALPGSRKTASRNTLRAERWCACSRIGVRRSRGSFCILSESPAATSRSLGAHRHATTGGERAA